MKRYLLILSLLAWPAAAQSPQPPADPAMTVCQQLLGEANGRVVQVSGTNASLQRQIESLQKELAALKAPPKAPDKKD